MERPAQRAIALFAKIAQAGRVKTRLVPPLSPHEAAQLARAFLRDSSATIQRVAARACAKVFVFFAPGDAGPWFREVLGDAVTLHPQSNGDLTQRLQSAYLALHRMNYTTVCFVGADSPTLPDQYIDAAFDTLRGERDLVVGSASDGGYYLLGLCAPHLEIFEGIEWSTPRVFSQTRDAAERLGLRLALLPEWYDIDDAKSLRRLTAELENAEQTGSTDMLVAPFTREFLSAGDLLGAGNSKRRGRALTCSETQHRGSGDRDGRDDPR